MHFSMFSSHRQVNSMRLTLLMALENMTISRHSWVKIMWEGKGYWSSRSTNIFQSNAWCKMPVLGIFLWGALMPFLANVIISFGFGGTDLMMLVNLIRVAKICDNTLSCLKVKLSSLRANYMQLKCVQLCKWFYWAGNRKLQRRFSSVWGYLVMV